MEFAACEACNQGTRGADAVAILLSSFRPDVSDTGWQAERLKPLIRTVRSRAPGVTEELGAPLKSKKEFVRRPSGILQPVVTIRADGPLVHGYMSVFAAKLGMALYREHVGHALPLDGAVWVQYNFNAGMTQQKLDSLLGPLPIFGTLQQGSKTVTGQFDYRFNTDERTVVAAICHFHRSLWVVCCASSNSRIMDIFRRPESAGIPASAMINPGELAGRVAKLAPQPTVSILPAFA